MTAQDIADMVMKMTPPLECNNEYAKLRWKLEQAADIAIQMTIDVGFRRLSETFENERLSNIKQL